MKSDKDFKTQVRECAEVRDTVLPVKFWGERVMDSPEQRNEMLQAIDDYRKSYDLAKDALTKFRAEREAFLNADLIHDLRRGGGGQDGTKGESD